MSKSTISTFELFAMFPDEPTARSYLERRRWPDGPRCPVCGLGERITARKDGYYRCNQCKEDFIVRTGTIFERSHVPLHKWIYAMYMLVTARKGVSSECRASPGSKVPRCAASTQTISTDIPIRSPVRSGLHHIKETTMRKTPYVDLIKPLAPDHDPRHVEAYMRLECGTLDQLTPSRFMREVAIACACINEDPQRAEALAKSFGF